MNGFEETLGPWLVAGGRKREPRPREAVEVVRRTFRHDTGVLLLFAHDTHGLETCGMSLHDRDVVGA